MNERQWLVLGNPENRRVSLFQAALRDCKQPPALVISYRDILRGKADLVNILARRPCSACVLRIDSPAEDHEVECRLIARGAELVPTDGSAGETIGPAAALRLREDVGRVRFARQWFAGFAAMLGDVERAIEVNCGLIVQNHPRAIALLFDKPRCHNVLAQRGVSVPPSLKAVASYDALREAMRSAGWARVFVKLAWGSSASGVVAFSTNGARPLAITTMELVQQRGQARFYNNLRLSRYRRERDLRAIFDFVCREGVQVERWLPKATLGDRGFDLRVVTFAGQACHTVVRTSRTPFTNLHLGNRRGDLARLKQTAGSRWSIVPEICMQAARAFPNALYVGWDVLVTPGFRQAYILEGNAFGDLLPSVTFHGRSTHAHGVESSLHNLFAPACR